MNPAVKSRRSSQKFRIPTTDLLLGLFAAVSLKLCSESGTGSPNIHLGSSCNVLRELQNQKEFSDVLKYLDFDRIGDSWISHALENFFFQAGAWGFHCVPNPAMSTITVPSLQAKNRLDEVKSKFGRKGSNLVDNIAEAFVQKLPLIKEQSAGPLCCLSD